MQFKSCVDCAGFSLPDVQPVLRVQDIQPAQLSAKSESELLHPCLQSAAETSGWVMVVK